MKNIHTDSGSKELAGIYHDGRKEDIMDYFNYHFSSRTELIDSAKESLLIREGVFYLMSSPMFDTIQLAIDTALQYNVFNHRFNDTIPDDMSLLVREMKKIGICKRLLLSIQHEKRIGNSIPIVHKEYDPFFVWKDKQTERYEIQYNSSTGGFEITTPVTSSDPIDSLSKHLFSIHKTFVCVLRNRCSSWKYERYVEELMDAYFINGNTAFDQAYDELQIKYLSSEIHRLRDTYGGKHGFGEDSRSLERHMAEYEELVKKYEYQDNYLGRWARDFIEKKKKHSGDTNKKEVVIKSSPSRSRPSFSANLSTKWVESILKKNNLQITSQTYDLLNKGGLIITEIYVKHRSNDDRKAELYRKQEQLLETKDGDNLGHLLGYAVYYFSNAYEGRPLSFVEMLEETYNFHSKDSWDANNIVKRLAFNKEWLDKCKMEEEAYKKSWEDLANL